MRRNIIAIAFILSVFGLLVLNRVDLGSQVVARVSRDWTNGTDRTYSENKVFRRGETVHTGRGEFVELFIGGMIVVDLDENTNLELKSLSRSNVRVGFGHGRILVNLTDNDGGNLEVDTPTAQNKVIGQVSFVGYDFKHETSVIPLFGSIHTTIPLLDRTFDVTSPITIRDVNPPTIEQIKFDEKTDARAEFYRWAEQK